MNDHRATTTFFSYIHLAHLAVSFSLRNFRDWGGRREAQAVAIAMQAVILDNIPKPFQSCLFIIAYIAL
jgi:hypothetical protein